MGKKINPKTATKLEGDCHIRFLRHCAHGGSIPQFCRNEEIDRDTFDRWCKTYPHMAAAKAKGKLWAEGWWIEQAQQNLITHSSKETGTDKFDTNLYKFIVGGRFGHTSDSNLDMRLAELERMVQMNAQTAPTQTGGYAEEAECENE